MSNTEEPPTKVMKNNEEPALSDTTAVSDLTDASMTIETLDLPETALPVGTDFPEQTDLPGLTDLPNQTDLLGVTDFPVATDLPVATDVPDLMNSPAQESLEMADNVSLEGTEMVEERLQDSVESEEAAESQEEWLSEGILTDDDFNPTLESAPDSQTSKPEAFTLEQANTNSIPEAAESKAEQNIEDALNTLEGGPERDDVTNMEEFLIKKTNDNVEAEEAKNAKKQEADDGNDTDDLLRMLGDDGTKTKKLTKTVKDVRKAARDATTDDDDYVFEGSAKKLKLSKTISKAPKEKSRDMDGSDQSSDSSEVRKPSRAAPQPAPVRYQETRAKNILSVSRARKDKVPPSTPLKARSLLKAPAPNSPVLKRESHHNTYTRKNQSQTSVPLRGSSVLRTVAEEKSGREEFLDDDFHELESEHWEESQDSRSEDGSLYDELPSSESDDADDWFQLDIRAEKAGEYLPLLGQKAKQLLLEEKKRVSSRLENLKQSLSALTESGKKQADQVRAATLTLTELDDMLKAS